MAEPTRARTGLTELGARSVRVLGRPLRAELRRTLSTRMWWALLLGAVLLSLLVTMMMLRWRSPSSGTTPLSTMTTVDLCGRWFAVAYGVICATGEFRHRTISTGYLATPRRGQFMAAKVVVAAAVGAGYALGCALAVQLLWLLVVGTSRLDALSGLPVLCAVVMVMFALWSAFGVGLGMLVGNRTVAVVGVLVYLLVVEPFLSLLVLPRGLGVHIPIESYFPGGSALATLTLLAGELPHGEPYRPGAMPWWLPLLVFVGYTALAVLAGSAAARGRDIT